ncbi:MAG: hypothetical protein JW394_1002 [Nitrospira sp.]|nr:hypothetical protein [Nitrospira sp.]
MFKSLLTFLLLPFSAVPMGADYPVAEEIQPDNIPTSFATQLKLTAERLDDTVQRALTRIEEISREMGLEGDGKTLCGSWMDHRIKNQAVYDNELGFREEMYGGVFRDMNLTRGVTKRFAREMSAKVSDDMLGTTPFFGAVKRRSGISAELTRAVEEFSQIKVEQSNLPITMREAQRSALVRNEAVVKVRYVEDSTFYVSDATVLADASGQPVTTVSGQFIYEDDDFADDPSAEGLMRLKKDPSFVMAEGQYGFVNFPELRQEAIRKKGIEGHVLDVRSFLCPLTVATIHDADIVVQLLDWSVEQIEAAYGQYDSARNYCNARTSGESQPKLGHGETEEGAQSVVVRTRRLAECYMRHDPDGTGPQELFIVLDLDSKEAIFYDYLDNHFHKRPFEVVVGVETVPNRWYGIGLIQMLWDQNIFADMQFNRIILKDSRESSATFADEMACKEWKGGAPIELGTRKVYRVEPGYDPQQRPPIWRTNLNEVSELGERLMQTVVQDMTTTFGVISAKDASASDLNNSRTATGVLNMERTANTLTRYTEQAQQVGLEAILRQAVVIALENMAPMEMFFSHDGEELLTLNKTEARSIEHDVRLFLTRARSTESLVTNQQAAAVVEKYHMLYEQSPQQLKYTRPIYIGQLKALEIMDADEMLPVVNDEYIQQWQEQRQAALQQQQTDNEPKEIINFKDAPPSIQAQMEQRAGLEPATPEERIGWLREQKPQPKAQPQPPKAA